MRLVHSSWKPEGHAGAAPRTVLLALAGLAAALLVALGVGCRSLSKPELERRLLALEKNAPVAALERVPIRFDAPGGETTLELVHHHAPRASSAASDVERVPVVLVHGTPSTLFGWTPLIHGGEGFEGLCAERDVHAIEVIGHGVAPGGGPVDFETCARFVAAAVRGLGLERVHLVGQSYGGEFAWRAALNEPELVASLVLIDSSGLARRPQDWLPEEVELRTNRLAGIGWMLNSRDRIETALAPHFRVLPPDRVEEFFLVCENASNWRAMVELARDENGERADELSGLRMPTLVLWGADDRAYPADVYAERFARAIPGARLVVLPETGHYPQEERPGRTARALEEFFDSVERTGGVLGGPEEPDGPDDPDGPDGPEGPGESDGPKGTGESDGPKGTGESDGPKGPGRSGGAAR